MKKVLLLALCVFAYFAGNSQNTNTQNLGAPRTLVINKGGFQSDSSLILPFFSDTTAANISPYIKTYRGNMIKVGDTVYVRNKSATKWIMMANEVTGDYVPYSGAKENVDLGAFDFYCDEIETNGSISSNGVATLFPDGTIYGDSLKLLNNNNSNYSVTLRTNSNINSKKNQYLPNSDGVLLSSVNNTFAGSNGDVDIDFKSVTYAGNVADTSIQIKDTLKIKSSLYGFSTRLIATNPLDELSQNRNFYFPNASGTLALKSDITSGYVPYTGATNNVQLGEQSLKFLSEDSIYSSDIDRNRFFAIRSFSDLEYYSVNVNGESIDFIANDNGDITSTGLGNSGLSVDGLCGAETNGSGIDKTGYLYVGKRIGSIYNGKTSEIHADSITDNRYLQVPDKSGTLALTSQVIDSLKRSNDSIYAYKNGTWRFQYKDSTGGGGGTGTVTSVATGYGLSGGTITNTGTISVDSSSLSNKYLRIVDTSNKWVSSVTGLNDSTIRVVKDGTTTDITIRSSTTVTSATRLVTTVYNNSGSTIAKGSVVYINGKHSSNLPTIALSQANTEQNSYSTFALVENDITNNNSGTIIQAGNITNLNLPTSTYTDGQLVYLSPTTAGGITTTKPLAPNHIVKIGTITRAHPTLGSIEIKIENGWQLDELSDVSIASVPSDSTLLQFSRVDSLWHDVSVTNAIGSKYLKPSDSSTYQTKYRTDTMRTNVYSAINGKQASGSYITTSDTSVFQRKNIAAYSFMANKTSAAANVTTNTFRDTSGTYSGTISWTGTTAPTNAGTHTYRWTQIGKMVTLNIQLIYTTAGSALTQVNMDLPSDCPTPSVPTGISGASRVIYYGSGNLTGNDLLGLSASRAGMIINSAQTGYQLVVASSSSTYKTASITIQYFVP